MGVPWFQGPSGVPSLLQGPSGVSFPAPRTLRYLFLAPWILQHVCPSAQPPITSLRGQNQGGFMRLRGQKHPKKRGKCGLESPLLLPYLPVAGSGSLSWPRWLQAFMNSAGMCRYHFSDTTQRIKFPPHTLFSHQEKALGPFRGVPGGFGVIGKMLRRIYPQNPKALPVRGFQGSFLLILE